MLGANEERFSWREFAKGNNVAKAQGHRTIAIPLFLTMCGAEPSRIIGNTNNKKNSNSKYLSCTVVNHCRKLQKVQHNYDITPTNTIT